MPSRCVSEDVDMIGVGVIQGTFECRVLSGGSGGFLISSSWYGGMSTLDEDTIFMAGVVDGTLDFDDDDSNTDFDANTVQNQYIVDATM